MFSGIITELGNVTAVEKKGNSLNYSIKTQTLHKILKVDSSVSIDGVCQSVTKINDRNIWFHAVASTLEKTTIGKIKINQTVNLEESLTLQKPIDGHLVYGHVNTKGKLRQKNNLSSSIIMEIEFPRDYSSFVISEGSIAVNGVSLTISKIVSATIFQVSLIPLTYSLTNFKNLKKGDEVNLEFDSILRMNAQVKRESNLLNVLKTSGYLC